MPDKMLFDSPKQKGNDGANAPSNKMPGGRYIDEHGRLVVDKRGTQN